jgi:hypothetical protein
VQAAEKISEAGSAFPRLERLERFEGLELIICLYSSVLLTPRLNVV